MTLSMITEVLPASSASVSPKADALGQRELLPFCSFPLAALPNPHKVGLQVPPKPRLQEQLKCTEVKGAGAGQDGESLP